MDQPNPFPPPKFYTNVRPPFFLPYMRSVSDSLAVKYRGMKRPKQNPADIGELCETFVKELLGPFFEGILRVHRGGKIVNVAGQESAQIDLLLTAQNTMKFFGDKGIYPIETVYGAIAITSTLALPKLKDDVRNLASIPIEEWRIDLPGATMEKKLEFTQTLKNNCPARCVFAFEGEISEKWIEDLLQLEVVEKIPHLSMPKFIIVNQRGMIIRGDGLTPMASGNSSTLPYHYADFTKMGDYFYWVPSLLHQLFDVSRFQRYMSPDYSAYFNQDIGNAAFIGAVMNSIQEITQKIHKAKPGEQMSL